MISIYTVVNCNKLPGVLHRVQLSSLPRFTSSNLHLKKTNSRFPCRPYLNVRPGHIKFQIVALRVVSDKPNLLMLPQRCVQILIFVADLCVVSLAQIYGQFILNRSVLAMLLPLVSPAIKPYDYFRIHKIN